MVYQYLSYILLYVRFNYTDASVFILFNEMLTDNRLLVVVAAMVTLAGCHRSLIQPYLWLVATYLPPKGLQRFYGRDLVVQPARASCQPQPAADIGRPWLACRRSQPADTSQASQPVITSSNYHTIVLKHTQMLK